MINLKDYEIFSVHTGSLKELSKDDSSPQGMQYATENEKIAVDFDEVKRLYVNEQGISENNAYSVDAISHTSDAVVFIEFKNGKVEGNKIKTKIWDSLLIFGDIVKQTVDYTRQNAEFVLVYNEEKNPPDNQMKKGVVQESSSRLGIAKRFAQLGKTEFIRWDLERYKKLYFRDVHTYTRAEFEEYANQLIGI